VLAPRGPWRRVDGKIGGGLRRCLRPSLEARIAPKTHHIPSLSIKDFQARIARCWRFRSLPAQRTSTLRSHWATTPEGTRGSSPNALKHGRADRFPQPRPSQRRPQSLEVFPSRCALLPLVTMTGVPERRNPACDGNGQPARRHNEMAHAPPCSTAVPASLACSRTSRSARSSWCCTTSSSSS